MTDAYDDLSRTQGVDAEPGRTGGEDLTRVEPTASDPDGPSRDREGSGDATLVAAGPQVGVDDDADPAELRRHERVRSIIEWVAVVVGALVVALVVKTFLFQAFYIPSASMEPTLEKGDRVLVNKLSYDLHDVNRGDVVVFELPPEEVGPDGIKDLIKRVVGLPGDIIETRDGVVYVNDRRLEEPYLADGMVTGDPTSGNNPGITRQTIPDGMVFVMGDNRANSHDSRYSDRGPIPIDSIVGRAFVIVWPLSELSGL
ncbi:MAG: signal peptidase I [Actinomycetota bacterium]